MTLNLNFLPDRDKKNLITTTRLCWCVNVLKITLFLIFIFNGFVFLINFLLAEQISMLNKRNDEVSKNYFFYNQEVNNINEQLSRIIKATHNYSIITPRLSEIINTLPNEIQLKNLVLSLEKSDQILISGIAKNRETLLNYKNILEKISWVNSTELPTSQLMQKENINFNMVLNVEPLNKKN